MKPTTFRAALMAAFLLAHGLSAPAAAQQWPSKPVKMVVALGAGSTPDIICRIITERLSRSLGQQFVVENRPGAGSIIAAQTVMRADPDGYTFLFGTAGTMISNVYTVKNLPSDPDKDFIIVSPVARGPMMVVANPGVPAASFADLLALAKKTPGALNFATDGPRNLSGMIAAWINKSAGVEIPQVPYATMPQGVQDALSGRIQLAIIAIPTAAPLIADGKLRALAVSSRERIPGYEKVPAIAETLPGFELFGWLLIAAPAGTPQEIVARMNREVGLVLDDKEFATRLAETGFYSFGALNEPAVADLMKREHAMFKKVVEDIGLQPQ